MTEAAELKMATGHGDPKAFGRQPSQAFEALAKKLHHLETLSGVCYRVRLNPTGLFQLTCITEHRSPPTSPLKHQNEVEEDEDSATDDEAIQEVLGQYATTGQFTEGKCGLAGSWSSVVCVCLVAAVVLCCN